jgi:hypothetical protein
VSAVQGVKAIGGVWLHDTDTFSIRWNAAVREHRLHALARDPSLLELQVGVAGLLR